MNRADRDGPRTTLIGALLFLLTFGVYNLTLCPTVYWYDSGELISACFNLGIAHPTGYPLYTILGRVFSLLPLGDTAFRVNVMSAFFGALTVVTIYLVVKALISTLWQQEQRCGDHGRLTWCGIEVPAITASLTYAFSPLFWTQTAMAEVYTLHTFLIALLILSLLLWARSSTVSSRFLQNRVSNEAGQQAEWKEKHLYLFSFLLGLSLGHHLTTLLFVPAFFFFIVAEDVRILKRAKVLAPALIFLLFGLSVDLYLLVRARLDPLQNWGDPETWGRLKDVVTGVEIRARPTRYAPHSIGELFTLLGQQFLLPGIVLGTVGIFSTIRKARTLFIFFLLFFAGMVLYILRNYDFLEDQYLPVFLVFALWIGIGTKELISSVAYHLFGGNPGVRGFISAVIFGLVLALPFSLFALNYRSTDKSRLRVAQHYGELILNNLDPESLLLSEDSNIPLLLYYFQRAEGRRPDVANIYLFLMEFDWYRRQLTARFPKIFVPILSDHIVDRIIEKNVRAHPVYYVPFSKEVNVDIGRLIPRGLLFQIQSERAIPSKSEIGEHFRTQDRFYRSFRGPLDGTSRDILTQLHGTMGLYFERIGLEDEALKEYTRALEIDSLNPGVHYDLGSFAMGRGNFREAAGYFKRVLELEPSNVNTHYLLGRCYAQIGELSRAIGEMERVVRSEPSEPLPHLELGALYGQMGETGRAIEQFEQALKEDPHNADILYNLGVAEAKSGRLEAAIGYLEQAEREDSNSVELSYALASSYAEKKDYAKALHYFQRSLRLGGPNPSILVDLGHLYLETGNWANAVETWEAALALDPSNTHLKTELSRLKEKVESNQRMGE
ncbi:MAG: protein O-mannosyl-transferase family [bacterium]